MTHPVDAGRRGRWVEQLESRQLLAATFASFIQVGAPPVLSGGNDSINAITLDKAGNQYVTGYFSNLVDFDPSPSKKFEMRAGDDGDTFVAKYSAAGALVWAQRVNNPDSNDQGTTIALDSAGNVIVGGVFAGAADFKPGAQRFELTSAGFQGAFGTSEYDGFLWKLTKKGKFVSAVKLGGDGQDVVDTIAIDASNNVYASGWMSGTAKFGKKTFVSGGPRDGFVAKLPPALNAYTFVKQVGGSGDDILQGLSLDPTGNPVVAGTFNGTADFDPGAGTANLTSKGGSDAVVLKLTPAGDFVFAKQLGGSGAEEGITLRVDKAGGILTAGPFNGTADFDPSGATSNLTSLGGSDVYVSKLNSAGAFAWARRVGGAQADGVRGITTDKPGNVYVTGQFAGTVDFDPGAGTVNLAGRANVANGFLWKLTPAGDLTYARMLQDQTNGFCEGAGLALDATGNVFVAGQFQGKVDFDPGAGLKVFQTGGDSSIDGFILKLLK